MSNFVKLSDYLKREVTLIFSFIEFKLVKNNIGLNIYALAPSTLIVILNRKSFLVEF